MKGLILISTVAFSLASFAASASEAPSESVCSLTHLKLVADKEGLDPAGALAKECIGKGYLCGGLRRRQRGRRFGLRQSEGTRQRRL